MFNKLAKRLRRQLSGRAAAIQYLNRDHVMTASLSNERLLVTTTFGDKIAIVGSADELATLVDQLVNSMQSNFMLISRTKSASHEPPIA